MKLFGKAGVENSPKGTPVEQVIAFRQQGLSNNQIVESLQRAGHSTDEIFTAMNQADLQNAGPVENTIPDEQLEQFPTSEPADADNLGQPPGYPPAEQEYAQEAPQEQEEGYDEEADITQFEELAEQIVEEKWQHMEQDRQKWVAWKQQVDVRLERIEQRFADVRMELQSLHKALFERMDSYDKSVSKVGVNLRAMDEVFKKTLPKLTENINDLSSLTDSLKKPSKRK